MLKFVFSVVCAAAAGLSLTLATPAAAGTTLWTAEASNGKVLMQDWPFGPASGAAGAFALESSTGSFLAPDSFLGFQFAADGTLWTAHESNGKVLMQDWPFGPAGGAAGAFALESSTGSFLAPDSFLGFQFAPDGTLWTANESNGKVLLQDWPFGPASGAAGAFALESSTGSFLAPDSFLGFQFAPDGTLWTANESNGKVLMQDWPFGPASGAAGAFALESSTGSFLAADGFLGFQFADDGTLWTANEANGKVLLQDWPFGPGSGAAGAFPLQSSVGSYVYADSFLGFQFVTTPDPGTAVPEPATWALLIAGFGLAGGSLRRARALAA